MVLKLKRSLCGLRKSPCNFCEFLCGKPENTGFVPSKVDPCLFVSDKVILMVCINNTLLFLPKAECVDKAIKWLKASGIKLEMEDQIVARFPGVKIDQTKHDGQDCICLLRAGLVKHIVEASEVGHLPQKDTPASAIPLVKDPDA